MKILIFTSLMILIFGCAPSKPRSKQNSTSQGATTGGTADSDDTGTDGDTGGDSTGDGDGTTSGDTGTDTGTDGNTAGVDSGTTGITFYDDIRPVFIEKCVTCHSVTPTQGAPATFRLDWVEENGVESVQDLVKQEVTDGTMPPANSPALTEEEKQDILQWIEDGLPLGDLPEPIVTLDDPLADARIDADGNFNFDYTIEFADPEDRVSVELYFTDGQEPDNNAVSLSHDDLLTNQIISGTFPVQQFTQVLSTNGVGDQIYRMDLTIYRFADRTEFDFGNFEIKDPNIVFTNDYASPDSLVVDSGSTANVTWSYEDTTIDPATDLNLEFSIDDGQNWSPASCSSYTVTGCTWAVSDDIIAETIFARLKITAVGKSKIGTDEMSDSFAVSFNNYVFDGNIETTLAAGCTGATCHGTGQANQGLLDVTTYSNGTTGVFDKRLTVQNRAVYALGGPMPAGGIDPDIARQLRIWILQGAPEN